MYEASSIESAVSVRYSLTTFFAIYSSLEISHIIASPMTLINPELALTTI